jgi:hypothetical protein
MPNLDSSESSDTRPQNERFRSFRRFETCKSRCLVSRISGTDDRVTRASPQTEGPDSVSGFPVWISPMPCPRECDFPMVDSAMAVGTSPFTLEAYLPRGFCRSDGCRDYDLRSDGSDLRSKICALLLQRLNSVRLLPIQRLTGFSSEIRRLSASSFCRLLFSSSWT